MTLSITRKIGILHRTAKEGSIKDNEKLCEVDENVLNNGMKALRAGGKWKCPICGIETTVDLVKKITIPMISAWGVVGLNVDKVKITEKGIERTMVKKP